jgi:hypothetical protein
VKGYFHRPAPASNLEPDLPEAIGTLSKMWFTCNQPGVPASLHKDGAEEKDSVEGIDQADEEDEVSQDEPSDLSHPQPWFHQ